MDIVPFDRRYFDSLFKCFVEVFSVSKGKIRLTREEFEIRIYNKLQINNESSQLIVEKDKVLGFVLHSVGEFHDQRYLYNGGTGILESQRKKRLGHVLLERALTAGSGLAEKVILEVVEDNEPALRLYESHGFRPVRSFRCFKRERVPTTSINSEVEIQVRNIGKVERFEGWDEFETSFADSLQHTSKNPYEKVLVASIDKEAVGYIMFQPHIGRISRLVVNPAFRRRYVASTLIKKVQELAGVKSLTMMNIPEDQSEMIQFLEAKGFSNGLNQIEMEKSLSN